MGGWLSVTAAMQPGWQAEQSSWGGHLPPDLPALLLLPPAQLVHAFWVLNCGGPHEGGSGTLPPPALFVLEAVCPLAILVGLASAFSTGPLPMRVVPACQGRPAPPTCRRCCCLPQDFDGETMALGRGTPCCHPAGATALQPRYPSASAPADAAVI